MLPQDLIQPPVGPVGACLAVVLQSRGPRALLELLCEVRLHGAGGAVAARSWPPLALKVAEVAGDWCHLQARGARPKSLRASRTLGFGAALEQGRGGLPRGLSPAGSTSPFDAQQGGKTGSQRPTCP